MGSILARQRTNGSTGYTAVVRLKRAGKIVHSESHTFDREQAAQAWIDSRETSLKEAGALDKTTHSRVTLARAIDKYVESGRKAIGRTKAQVLESIKRYEIADIPCPDIKSRHIVEFATTLSDNVQPATVANYVSHLSAVFRMARPAWATS